MSDRASDSIRGAANQASQVLDSSGQAARRGGQQAADQAQGTLEQVRDYIVDQPFSATLLALGIGYIVGRLHIL